jgi:hypothetical protein
MSEPHPDPEPDSTVPPLPYPGTRRLPGDDTVPPMPSEATHGREPGTGKRWHMPRRKRRAPSA